MARHSGFHITTAIYTLVHYKSSIASENLSPLWKDVFLHHWKEESQHAILDELEWKREDAKITPAERDRGVDELIELVGAVDGVLQAQAQVDADYFLAHGTYSPRQEQTLRDTILRAYRWQHIVSGVKHGQFVALLIEMCTPAQLERIQTALRPLL